MNRQIAASCFVLVVLLQCKPSQVNKGVITLENTHWRLAEMNGNPIITIEGGRDVHFMLTSKGEEKLVTGYAGCNSMSGTYKLQANKVSFVIASTKMMCPSEQMEVEDFLFMVLSSTTSYKIDGDELELMDGETALAEFKAIN